MALAVSNVSTSMHGTRIRRKQGQGPGGSTGLVITAKIHSLASRSLVFRANFLLGIPCAFVIVFYCALRDQLRRRWICRSARGLLRRTIASAGAYRRRSRSIGCSCSTANPQSVWLVPMDQTQSSNPSSSSLAWVGMPVRLSQPASSK
jgi:hypothetical protein